MGSMTEPIEVRGTHASLVPLSPTHAPALSEASRDGDLWKLWYTSVPSPDGMAAEIARRPFGDCGGSEQAFTGPDPRRIERKLFSQDHADVRHAHADGPLVRLP